MQQAILLVLNDHSTYQESDCQAMHKQEAQNMVCCILHEVQAFVIVTLGGKKWATGLCNKAI
jgi:hypothetical protein